MYVVIYGDCSVVSRTRGGASAQGRGNERTRPARQIRQIRRAGPVVHRMSGPGSFDRRGTGAVERCLPAGQHGGASEGEAHDRLARVRGDGRRRQSPVLSDRDELIHKT